MVRVGVNLKLSLAHFVEHLEGILDEAEFTQPVDESIQSAPSGHPFGDRSNAFEEIMKQGVTVQLQGMGLKSHIDYMGG